MPFAVKLSHFSYSFLITLLYMIRFVALRYEYKQCRYVRSDGTVVFGGVMGTWALVCVLPCRQIATSRYQLQLPHQSISFDHPRPSSSWLFFEHVVQKH